MAGHSKWANIQHRKGRQDEKRGRVWTRITREIIVAARSGGGDPNMNPRLRLAIDKAKAANMPADNIKRNVDKATGNLEGVNYEEIRYEGYGIGGVAIIVDTMTDNKVRTVAEVRHAFSKNGGNMGTEGSVAFQFKHCGQLIFAPGSNEDQIMEIALENGADDVITDDDGAIEVISSYRASLGSMSNRLQMTSDNLSTAMENVSAANSRIEDADIATEMSELVRTQILQQAGISVLAQANQAPSLVLQLLK